MAATSTQRVTSGGRLPVPNVPDRARDRARMPSRRVRRPRLNRTPARDPLAADRRRHLHDARTEPIRADTAVLLRRHVLVRG